MSSSAVARRSAGEPRSPSWSPSEEMAQQNRKKLKKKRRHSDSNEDGEIDSDAEKRHREKRHHGKKRRNKNKENDDSLDEDSIVDTKERKSIEENVDDDRVENSKDREYKKRDSRDQDYKSRDYRNRDYDRSYSDRDYRDTEYGRGYREKGFRDRDFRHEDYSNRDFQQRDNRDRNYRDRENRDWNYRHRNREDRGFRDRDDNDRDRGWDRSHAQRNNDRRGNGRRDREDREDRHGIGRAGNKADSEKFDLDKQDKNSKENAPSISRDKAEEKKKASDSKAENEDLSNVPASIKPVTESQKKVVDMLTSKTGGAYIPPAKLKMMQAQITDKASAAYQRIAWEALKKSIHGHINKVNTGNLATIVRELLKENLVRGCGLLCRSIIQAQAASPTFTKVYAALAAVINSRFPQIGELLLKRVVIQFKRGFRRNDKSTCISSAIFIAHLVNQDVAHELLALEILVLLMENPTSDSVEVAIAFLKEVVEKLLLVARRGTMAIQDMLRNILHEGTLDKRVQYMIEVMFQMIKVGGTKKEGEEEDQLEGLVDEEDQITHIINLDDATDGQDILNVFKLDPDYEANEAAYKKLREEILGSDSESGEGASDEDDEDSSEDSEDEEKSKDVIIDKTETNLVALRRTIYLTIQSSLDFEECAHKLLRMQLKPGQELEMCHMILDCCAEMRSYEKFFGLLAQRFCMINKMYVAPFQQIFIDSYATIHRLEINKLRNVAKLFAHLLFTHAISWEVLSTCKLTEEDSTSSSRIFVKILFQELSEYMGLTKLNEQLKDPTLQSALEGLFPRDDPRNTRFAINFFTSIGLGGLTDDLREHLKSQPKNPAAQLPVPADAAAADSGSSSSSSSSSSSDSSSSDSD